MLQRGNRTFKALRIGKWLDSGSVGIVRSPIFSPNIVITTPDCHLSLADGEKKGCIGKLQVKLKCLMKSVLL